MRKRSPRWGTDIEEGRERERGKREEERERRVLRAFRHGDEARAGRAVNGCDIRRFKETGLVRFDIVSCSRGNRTGDAPASVKMQVNGMPSK